MGIFHLSGYSLLGVLGNGNGLLGYPRREQALHLDSLFYMHEREFFALGERQRADPVLQTT